MKLTSSTATKRHVLPIGIIQQAPDGEFFSELWPGAILRLGRSRERAEFADRQARRMINDQGLSLERAQAAILADVGLALALQPPAKLLDIFDVHLHCNTLGLHPDTARDVRAVALFVLETVHCKSKTLPLPTKSKGRELVVADHHVAEADSTFIDENFADVYASVLLGNVDPESQEGKNILLRAKDDLGHVGRFFSDVALQAYAAAGLNVPDPREHLDLEVIREKTDKPPHDREEIEAAHELLRYAAARGQKLLFFILGLALLGGLRRGEIMRVKRTDLHRSSEDGPGVNVVEDKTVPRDKPREDTKCEHDRFARLPEWFFDALVDFLDTQPEGRLLVGTKKARAGACSMVARLLRTRAKIKAVNSLHRCRSFYAGYLCRTQEPEVIERWLGHNEIETTITYYSRHPIDKDLVPSWEEVIALSWAYRKAP